jgi:hypothetical protein
MESANPALLDGPGIATGDITVIAGDTNVLHRGLIGTGGYGEVHEVRA